MAKNRRGMGKGKGSGWKNLNLDDPKRHGLSAKGIKSAQKLSPRVLAMIKKNPNLKNLSFEQLKKKGVFLKYHADSDKDGKENIDDCKPLNKKKQDLKEEMKELSTLPGKLSEEEAAKMIQTQISSQERKVKFEEAKKKGITFLKKAGTKAKELVVKGAKETKVLAEKGVEVYKERLEKKKETAMREVEHPLMTKLDQQKDRVEELEKQVITEDSPDEKRKLDRELDREQTQLRQIQEKVTETRLSDLSNEQLKTLAVRYEEDDSLLSIFSFSSDSSNKYERELLKRIRKKADITRREKEINMRESAETERLEKRLKEEKKRLTEDSTNMFGF